MENTVTKTGYGGGRGHGRGPPSVVDVMVSNLTLIVTDSSTHCGRYCHTRETCCDLNVKPQNVYTTPTEIEHPNEPTE